MKTFFLHLTKRVLAIIVFFSFQSNLRAGQWTPPSELIGVWTDSCEVFGEFKKGAYPSTFPEDWLRLDIQIFTDGRAEGQVGGATLVGCRVKKNRGTLQKVEFQNGLHHKRRCAEGPSDT